jgi:hypothetical protein
MIVYLVLLNIPAVKSLSFITLINKTQLKLLCKRCPQKIKKTPKIIMVCLYLFSQLFRISKKKKFGLKINEGDERNKCSEKKNDFIFSETTVPV